MGYETRYHLEIENKEEILDSLKLFLNKRDNYQLLYLLTYDEYEAKWYEHEIELSEFSKNFPSILFKLYGIGENWGDFWIKYFKNGKMKKHDCTLSHTPLFSEKELI